MAGETFRKPLQPGQARFVEGASGRDRLPFTANKESSMARLEGTGKDPLGRYGKGEIFDVPRFTSTPEAVNEGVDPVENPTYRELLEKGYAKEVDPADDPGRTVTQIADSIVSQAGGLSHPADAAIAADISEADAYAIVHSGDPKATAEGSDLKTDAIREAQQPAKNQFGGATLAEETTEEKPKAKSSASSGSGSSS